MELWRKVWREGVAPNLSVAGLQAMRRALATNDPFLCQGATTVPPPLDCVRDWPCEAACPIAYAGWQGEGLATVGEVEEYFARIAFECDQRIGEPAVVRYFLNWTDDTPRDEMRRELLSEIDLALLERYKTDAG